ncbi:MAG: enoyl-CoA hydratase/isomerase family protein [Hyphomicrobiaceae bacterium]
MSEVVLSDLRRGTLVVTLNRPAVLNAVNRELREALTARLAAAEADPAVKAVVLTGTGKAFSAGQDLAEAASAELADVRAWCDGMRAMYQSVRALSKPSIAAFNGIAAGAGMQIGLCADLRITHAAARIGQPEVKAGLASVVGSYLLSLYVGHGANRELSLSGGLVTGEQAFALGIVNRLVPEGEVLDTALMFAEEMRRVPQAAFKLTKQRFREQTQPGFDEATAYGVRAMLEGYATGEPQRVMRAFVEARAQRKGKG